MYRHIGGGATAMILLVLFTGCAEEVTGPEPQMAGAEDQLATDPGFACNEDPGTWITLSGEDFSPLVIDAIASDAEHDVEFPTVLLTLAADPYGEATDVTFNVELASPLGAEDGQIRWLDGETLQFRVADDLDLPPGVYDVQVTNPNGQSVVETEAFGILPRPKLDAVIPEMTCVAQGDREITLEGEDILVAGDTYPTVTVDGQDYDVVAADQCQGLHAVFGDYQLCGEATTIIDEDSLAPGTYPVSLENIEPAACPSDPDDDGVNLTIAPPPTVDTVEPSPVCGEQVDYEAITIGGSDFLVVGDGPDRVYPEVHVGDSTYAADAAAGCEAVDEVSSLRVERCTELSLSIAAGDLGPQIDDEELVTYLDLRVENPDPIGCESTEDSTLGVVPPPEVTAVSPRAFCTTDDTVMLDVEGDGLFEVDGQAPQIAIGDSIYESTGVDCTNLDGEDTTRSCAGLEVEIDPSDLDGVATLVAINPEPMACESADSDEFIGAPAPVITESSPDGFCDDENFDGQLTLSGPFIYDTDGQAPTVTIDGVAVDNAQLMDCSPVVDDLSVESCERIELTIDPEAVNDEFDVTVTATEPLACGADTITLERTTPPTVDAVIPGRVCADGSTFVVQGTDLHPDAEFILGGQSADSATVAADGMSAEVTFDGPVFGDFATLEVINPGDCGSSYEEDLRVTDGPLPVFVDPPVVFDEMNTQVTIYAAGLYGGTVDKVDLIHPDGTTTELESSFDSNRPSVIQATIPAGILTTIDDSDLNSEGTGADFGVRLTDQEITCANETEELVTITSDLTVAIDSVEPPFGAQDQATGITIDAVAQADLEANETQFEATPRAYLNPVGGDADTLAREVRSIQFIDEATLNGIVPEGLAVGFYDLIVVNPDGSVGILDAAFQVTEERPPLIDSVSPGSWETNEAALSVEIEGANFRDTPAPPTVEVFCRPSGSDETDEALLNQPASITIDNVADDLVEATVNTDGLDHLDACYMRLTNSDGTYAEYSPVTVTNPAGKFVEFNGGTAFDTARRGPTLFSGVPSRAARYLYVVGGDDGTLDGTYATGEFSRINRFGEPEQWNYLPFDLPQGRSLANGVRIDDFLYLLGGHDGTQVRDEVLRAQVLDPLDTPEIVGLDLEVEQLLDGDGPTTTLGLDAGTYYYRVSAVYSDDDPANPNGESLASEPQPVSLPVDGAELTIDWVAPPQINHDVAYYRVYRSVNPDDPYGGESLIYETADADETSFVDDGTIDPIAGDEALKTGSLGAWHEVATLNHPRMVAGITSAQNPTDDSEHFLYAIGGEDDNGDFRDDYEFVSVTVDGPREQEVMASVLGLDGDGNDMLLPAPRAEFVAVTANANNASVVANVPPQIFTIAGQVDGGGGGNDSYVATVGDDGHLTNWQTTTSIIAGSRMGHAAAAINNNVAAAGGSNGAPSSQALHSEISCDDAECPPAAIDGWQSLSNVNMTDRVWMGHVTFRGFWYLAGGLTAGDVPSNTVDYSVAGGAP